MAAEPEITTGPSWTNTAARHQDGGGDGRVLLQLRDPVELSKVSGLALIGDCGPIGDLLGIGALLGPPFLFLSKTKYYHLCSEFE